MIYRAVIFKSPEEVVLPSGVDRDAFIKEQQSAREDFETNHKDSARRVSKIKEHDDEVSYSTLKSIIDEHMLSFSDVKYYEDDKLYYLYLDLFPLVVKENTPLSAGQEYISDIFSTSGYSKIVGSIFSDARGVLWVMQRNDGQNWDIVHRVTVRPKRSFGFSVEVMGNEGMVKFRALQDQSVFRLFVRLRRV